MLNVECGVRLVSALKVFSFNITHSTFNEKSHVINLNVMISFKRYGALACLVACALAASAQNRMKGDYGYLYCHMSDRGEYTAYALSRDGYHYEDLIGGDAVIDPKEHARIEGGQRDAYVCRSWDGKGFVMVTTDMCVAKSKKWDNYGIDLLKSDDLIHWTSVTFDYRQAPAIFTNPEAESVYKDWSTVNRVWAPQIFWDPSYV